MHEAMSGGEWSGLKGVDNGTRHDIIARSIKEFGSILASIVCMNYARAICAQRTPCLASATARRDSRIMYKAQQHRFAHRYGQNEEVYMTHTATAEHFLLTTPSTSRILTCHVPCLRFIFSAPPRP